MEPDDWHGKTVYEAVVGENVAIMDVIQQVHGVDLIPANLDLAAAELDLNGQYSGK